MSTPIALSSIESHFRPFGDLNRFSKSVAVLAIQLRRVMSSSTDRKGKAGSSQIPPVNRSCPPLTIEPISNHSPKSD